MARRGKNNHYRDIDLTPIITQALASETGPTRAAAVRLAGHILSEVANAFGRTLGSESEPAIIVIDAAVEISQHRIFRDREAKSNKNQLSNTGLTGR